jgi:hypothetical protein
MTDNNKMVEMFGLATRVARRQNKAPRNGKKWEVFSLTPFLEKSKNSEERSNFEPVSRSVRQNGKIEEAQTFRKWQGAYLKARLHFWKISQHESSYLKWWFNDLHRVLIHHFLMVNYYLEDRPTMRSELVAAKLCSEQKLKDTLRHAVDMGSLEVDQVEYDKRERVYYPTRGLVADTDMLFGRKTDHPETEGIYRHWNRSLKNDEFGSSNYHVTAAMLDAALEEYDNYFAIVGKFIPDMRQD